MFKLWSPRYRQRLVGKTTTSPGSRGL